MGISALFVIRSSLQCSKSCGTGHKTRAVQCVDLRDSSPSVDCDVSERPSNISRCSQTPCNQQNAGTEACIIHRFIQRQLHVHVLCVLPSTLICSPVVSHSFGRCPPLLADVPGRRADVTRVSLAASDGSVLAERGAGALLSHVSTERGAQRSQPAAAESAEETPPDGGACQEAQSVASR